MSLSAEPGTDPIGVIAAIDQGDGSGNEITKSKSISFSESRNSMSKSVSSIRQTEHFTVCIATCLTPVHTGPASCRPA